MPDGRALRFVLEVALLAGVAVALGVLDVRPLGIVVSMAAVWALVAIAEWVALRETPHYASGAPPRFHQPRTRLPPARPVEQAAPYPTAPRFESPTWAGRGEEAGDAWPMRVPLKTDQAEEKLGPEPAFAPAVAAADPWYVQELPAQPGDDARRVRLVTHRVDPFAEAPGRRLFRRRRPDEDGVVEVPALPRHRRLEKRQP